MPSMTRLTTLGANGYWSAVGLGAMISILLVIGVPFGTSHFGLVGFLVGTSAVVILSLLNAVVCYRVFRVGSIPARDAWRASLGILNPFAAGRSPEILLELRLRSVPVSVALRALLPRENVQKWLRPIAFDWATDCSKETPLATGLGAEQLRKILKSIPAVPGASMYCPRCGTGYLAGTLVCNGCQVSLEVIPDLTRIHD